MGWLRLFIALSIAVGHAGSRLPPWVLPLVAARGHDGSVMLHFFFVLSGFFVKMMFEQRLVDQPMWIGRFYLTRFLRLMPGYYAVLALTLVWIGLTGIVPAGDELTDERTWRRAGTAWFWFHNLTFLDPAFANPLRLRPLVAPIDFVVGPTWSLANEWLFLLVAPWLLRTDRAVLTLLPLSALVHGFYLWHGVFRNHIYAEAVYFLLGGAAWIAYRRWLKPHRHRHPVVGWWMVGAVVLAVCTWGAWRRWMPVQLAHEAFVALVVVAVPVIFAFVRPAPREQLAGDMAFPVYLGHTLIFSVVGSAGVPRGWIGVVGLVGTLVFGFVMVKLVDHPLKEVRRRLERGAPRVGPASTDRQELPVPAGAGAGLAGHG